MGRDLNELVVDLVDDITGLTLTEEDLGRPLPDLGLESLDFVDLLAELADHLDVELDDELLATFLQCGSLAEVLRLYEQRTPDRAAG